MAHPPLRFVSRFAFLVFVSFLLLLSCQNPLSPGSSASTTGKIEGHARYTGLSDHSGITISAESTDGTKTLTVSRMLAGVGVGSKAVAAQVVTDATGAYKLTGLPEGTYTVYASSQNSFEKAVTTGVTVVAGESVTASDLCLTPTGQISGTATLNGATSGNLGIVVFIAGTSYSAMTDDTGAYTISSVPAGTGYVLVASTSKQGYDTAITNVEVTAGSTTTAATLNLPPHVAAATTGSVSGTAQLNGGATGNTGIFVYLVGTSYITMTNDAGAFSLTAVAPGSYALVASKEGYSSAAVSTVVVTVGNTTNVGTINLTLGPVLGAVTTLAGTAGSAGSTDGLLSTARFYNPQGITTDGTNLYVADSYNHTIRKIVISTGAVTTLAGTAGSLGSVDGTGSAARFNYPMGITTDGTYLYMVEYSNHTIRKIVISTGAVTTLAGTAGSNGSADGTGSAARFSCPRGITTDGTNLYVADTQNQTIRKIVISSGAVTTLAGSAGSYGGADGTGSAARFNGPYAITTDGTLLYVADSYNYTIRKIVIATGAASTLAGAAGASGSADGTGTAARFYNPYGITTDRTKLYVVDSGNSTIREIR